MGKRPSSAPYYLEQRDLGLLLQQIYIHCQTRKRNASSTDLLNLSDRLKLEDDDSGNDKSRRLSTKLDRRTSAFPKKVESTVWYPEGIFPAAIAEQDPVEESSQIPADDTLIMEKLNSDKKLSKENLNHSLSWNEISGTKVRSSNPVSMIEDEELEKIIIKSNTNPEAVTASPLIVQTESVMSVDKAQQDQTSGKQNPQVLLAVKIPPNPQGDKKAY